jgi:hypothetical protein
VLSLETFDNNENTPTDAIGQFLTSEIITKLYPKVSGLSRNKINNKHNNKKKTLAEKQNKGLWWQNSLEWLTK